MTYLSRIGFNELNRIPSFPVVGVITNNSQLIIFLQLVKTPTAGKIE